MKFMLCGIALAAAAYFAVQTPAARAALSSVKASGRGVATHIVGNLGH